MLIAGLALGAGSGLHAQGVCNYSLSYNSLSIPPAGNATNSVMVNTGGFCGWTASSDVSWITIVSGFNGTGPGSVGFSVSANTSSSRVGHITVQGQVLAITEVALLGPQAQVQQIWMARNQVLPTVNTPVCTTAPGVVTTFSPTDAAAYVFLQVALLNPNDVISTQYFEPNGTLYPNAGGSYTVGQQVQSVCWEDQGMQIVGAAPASIPGVWTVNVSVNGVLVITTSFTITGVSACSYSLGYTSLSVPPLGGNGYTVGLLTSNTCAWTAVSNVPWIIITADASGTGPANVVFTVQPNLSGSRTGNLVIGGQTVAITQIASAGPTAQIGPVWMTHIPFPNSITPCTDASVPATTFAPTDAAAYLYVSIAQANPGDVISDQYLGPDGSVYANAGGSITLPGAPVGCWEDPGLVIRGAPAANLTGNWTVNVYVNNVLVITTTFTMLPGVNCTYSLGASSANFPANGGMGSIAVTASPGCSWAAATSSAWIHINSGSPGTGNGAVSFSADANPGAARSGSVVIGGQTFTVNQASGLPTLPTISQGGIADPWTYTAGIAPGAWVSIFGANLANSTASWSPTLGSALATQLAGVSVTINGIAAASSYVSPTLINVLVPASVALGTAQVVVNNNGLSSAPYSVLCTQFLPAIYSNPAPGTSPPRYYVTAVDPLTNNLLGNPSADPRVIGAPRAGDTIDLYALGLGPASQFPTGIDFAGDYPLTASLTVSLGGVPVAPDFVALVAPGLYQMRIAVPATLPPGDQPIYLNFGGGVQSAPNVFLTLQR